MYTKRAYNNKIKTATKNKNKKLLLIAFVNICRLNDVNPTAILLILASKQQTRSRHLNVQVLVFNSNMANWKGFVYYLPIYIFAV